MKGRDNPQPIEQDKRPRTGGWRAWLSQWFQSQPRVQVTAEAPEEIPEPLSYPLPARQLDAIKTAYLGRLRERIRPLYVYGLDGRRRAAQESGQVLDLLCLYTSLVTTAQVPSDVEASTETGALNIAPGSTRTRALLLREAAGRARRATILGPRGSGRSTFLRFLALNLAEAYTEREPTALERLKPAWTHGRLFPVLVNLGDFTSAAAGQHTAQSLCEYIAADLGIYTDQLQHQVIVPGGVLFLLDDVDRAPVAVAHFLERFGDTANSFFVTGPQYLDLSSDWAVALRTFAEIQLAPWTVEQMDDYAHRWYAELESQEWVDAETARDLPVQLSSALRRQEVQALARRPSWMTLIALLQTLRGRLPPGPTMFYHELLDLTLSCWREGREEDERDLRPIFDLADLLDALARATYQAYAHLEQAPGLVGLSESDLRTALFGAFPDGTGEAVADLMDRLLTRPTLLEEQAPDLYTWPNTSLQAYVAARHLTAQPDLPWLLAPLAGEDFYRWREVVLFAIAQRARVENDLRAAVALVDTLCPRSYSSLEKGQTADSDWRLAWLAGEALAAITPGSPSLATPVGRAGTRDHAESLVTAETVVRVQQWLVGLLERGMLAPRERSQAGNALDRLSGNDPRPGVSSPEPLWCEVPAGPFWQGEGEAAHQAELDSFWIARYPVTKAQYAAFIRATGRQPPGHWQGDRPPPGLGNHPAVFVTWSDAAAYCQWWSQRLQSATIWLWRPDGIERLDRMPTRWVVRLPTSTEWEKAARGGFRIPARGGDELADNRLPRRIYPWGDSWTLSRGEILGDETRCNVAESDIGTTTPVGMYPSGISPYGLMDMSGNVWEWCLDWADAEQCYRVRRGGAYRYSHEHARCSAYDRAHPDLAWPYMGFRIVLGPPVMK